MFEYMNMNMTIFHGLTMFVFWFILIYLLISILNTSEKKTKESALDILKKRLAKGEITKEQYSEIRKSLV